MVPYKKPVKTKLRLSDKTINRLTLYRSILLEHEKKGYEYLSSPKIADLLKIDNSQIRKDIRGIYGAGKCKIGYKVKELRAAIETSLGFNKIKRIFIVGIGNLGTALAKYGNFKEYGFEVTALFDNDPVKINTLVQKKKIFSLSKLPELSKKLKVETAILTVSSQQAQQCVNFLIEAGIKYIWSFAPIILKAPNNIHILNENLIGNLLQFFISNNTNIG